MKIFSHRFKPFEGQNKIIIINTKIKILIFFQTDCGTQNRLGSKQGDAIARFIHNNSGSGYCWAECQPSLLDGWANRWYPFSEAHGSTSTATGLSVRRIKRRVSKSAWESAWWLVQSQDGNGWFPWYSGPKAGERFADPFQRSPWWEYQQHHPGHQPGWHHTPNKSSCQLDYLRHLVLTNFFIKINYFVSNLLIFYLQK